MVALDAGKEKLTLPPSDSRPADRGIPGVLGDLALIVPSLAH